MQAVMDIGTNSCRLLIVNQIQGRLETLCRRLVTTRIGQGQGENQRNLTEAGMKRTLAALAEFKQVISQYPVDQVYLLGTQALRQADNRRFFCQRVQAELGWQLEIIEGRREAYLSYLGASSALGELTLPVVLDIGGGSTEIMYVKDGEIQGASAPIGGLRLLEQPLAQPVILQRLIHGWEGLALPLEGTLVGVGGTATTLAAIHLGMQVYNPEALESCCLRRQAVGEILNRLEGMTGEQRLTLPGMLPGREDILPWGLRILLAAMDCCGFTSLRVCDRDLMYGILLEKA